MNLTARDWLTVIGLALFLWCILGAFALGIITLAAAIA